MHATAGTVGRGEEAPAGLYGICIVCTETQTFAKLVGHPRDGYICRGCKARMRDRDVAQAVLAHVGRGRVMSIRALAEQMKSERMKLRILEPAYASPFARQLRGAPGYTQTYFWSTGAAPDPEAKNAVPYADLRALDFPENTFDLVISSDVLPFVDDDTAAFREILRVLRPGGVLVAALPIAWPLPAETVELYRVEGDARIAVAEERRLSTPEGIKVPLYRNYGVDLVGRVNAMGFAASLRRSSAMLADGRRVITLAAQKIGG